MFSGGFLSCPYSGKNELRAFIRSLNCRLVPKGVRLIPMRVGEDQVLFYIYRPGKLASDLAIEAARELLEEYDYTTDDPGKCIVQLRRRINESDEFSHGIGLFLGYPPEDVRGFIENHARNCKCTGCWKVYGDEQHARKQFECFKKCTDVYCDQWAKGKSIERLTVAV